MTHWGEDALEWCRTLADQVERAETGSTGYLSATHHGLHDLLIDGLNDAGLIHWRDAAGNLWGRLASERAEAPIVVLGAHLDTDLDSDPFLGVVLPLLVLRSLKQDAVQLPFHLDLVAFANDDGHRFGVPHLGSTAVSGGWDAGWTKLRDRDDISLAEAWSQFGLDSARAHRASLHGSPVMAYLETGIEQGPVLESEELPVGIVTALAGTRRFSIEFNGTAGHAGTVPMHLRQDALAAAAEFILIVERVAREHGVNATVGRIESHPGDAEVIAGQARISLDLRSEQDASRDAALSTIWETARLACQEREIEMEWVETRATPAVTCADWLQLKLAHAIENSGLRPRYLVSGTDQDAAAMARLCPVAMLFVRCQGGDSHQGDKAVSIDDADVAGQVLNDWVLRLAKPR